MNRTINKPLRKLLSTSLAVAMMLGTLTACQTHTNIGKSEAAASVSSSVTTNPSTAISASPSADPSPVVTESTAPIDYSQIQVPVMDSSLQEGAHKLAFFSNHEQAVILGGIESPYYIKGTFNLSETTGAESSSISYQGNLSDPKPYSQVAYSQDRDSLVFMMNVNVSRIGDLMYFDGEKAVKIADSVSSFTYANDGGTAAYEKGNSLYKYDCRTGSAELVCDSATSGYILSPNGDTIAYTTMTGPVVAAYYSTKGKEPLLITSKGYPLAVTDDGSTIYFTSYDEELSAMHDGQITSLGYFSVEIFTFRLLFSRDCTQVVFGKDDAGSYFSDKGSTPVKISDYTYSGLFGWQADGNDAIFDKVIVYSSNKNYYPQFADSDTLFDLPISAYKGTDSYLISFDKDMKVHTYSLNQPSVTQVQRNGRSVLSSSFYSGTGAKLFYIGNYLDPESEPEVLDDYTNFYNITSGGTIYYSNDIGQIFMIRGTDSPVKIDTYARILDSFDANGTTFLYYQKFSGEQATSLWCIEDKADATPMRIAKEISSARVCDFGVIYQTLVSDAGGSQESIYNLYYSTGGINFSFAMKLPHHALP